MANESTIDRSTQCRPLILQGAKEEGLGDEKKREDVVTEEMYVSREKDTA